MIKKINTPLNERIVVELKAGDNILLSGTVYTARDAAHARLINLLDKGESLPINIKDKYNYMLKDTDNVFVVVTADDLKKDVVSKRGNEKLVFSCWTNS